MGTVILLTLTGLGLAALYFLVASGLSLVFGLADVHPTARGGVRQPRAAIGCGCHPWRLRGAVLLWVDSIAGTTVRCQRGPAGNRPPSSTSRISASSRASLTRR